MSFQDHQSPHGIYTIGDKNPFIGARIRVTWRRNWGKKPKGYTVTGELKTTFTPNGRTMLGEIVGRADDLPVQCSERRYSCPWSRNYLNVEILG